MNVTCTGCATVYRVDPAKIPSSGVRARCSVCAAVFEVRRVEEAPKAFAPRAVPETAARAPAAPTIPEPAAEVVAAPAPPPTHAPPPAPPTALQEEAPPVLAPIPAAPPPRPALPTPAAIPRPAVAPPVMPGGIRETLPRQFPPAVRQSVGAPPAVRPTVPPTVVTPAATPPVRPTVPTGGGPLTAPVAPKPPAPPGGAPRPPAAQASATTAAPKPGAPRPVNPFMAQDPGQKARRLARALISDLAVYYPDRRKEGLQAGTLKQLFQEEIKKSWEEYTEQVGKEVAESTTYFTDALNEILASGQKIF